MVLDSFALRDLEGVLPLLAVLFECSGPHLLPYLQERVEEDVKNRVRIHSAAYASASASVRQELFVADQFGISLVDGQLVADTFRAQPPTVKVAIEQTRPCPSGCKSRRVTGSGPC